MNQRPPPPTTNALRYGPAAQLHAAALEARGHTVTIIRHQLGPTTHPDYGRPIQIYRTPIQETTQL